MLKPLSEIDLKKKAHNCFHNQRRRCHFPTNPYFKSYGAKGIRVEYTRLEFIEWFVREFKKFNGESPTVGRIDHSGNYSFSNIRFESLVDNTMERIHRCGPTRPRRPVHIIDAKTNEIIKTVESQTEAEVETGISGAHIAAYCKGRLGVTKSGLTFRYVDEKPTDKVIQFRKKSKLKCPILICDGKTSEPIFIAYYGQEVRDLTGIQVSHIGKYCRGELKLSKAGYSFKYWEEK